MAAGQACTGDQSDFRFGNVSVRCPEARNDPFTRLNSEFLATTTNIPCASGGTCRAAVALVRAAAGTRLLCFHFGELQLPAASSEQSGPLYGTQSALHPACTRRALSRRAHTHTVRLCPCVRVVMSLPQQLRGER